MREPVLWVFIDGVPEFGEFFQGMNLKIASMEEILGTVVPR